MRIWIFMFSKEICDIAISITISWSLKNMPGINMKINLGHQNNLSYRGKNSFSIYLDIETYEDGLSGDLGMDFYNVSESKPGKCKVEDIEYRIIVMNEYASHWT